MSIFAKSTINERPDRISISFSEDAADVDCIITVTFDRKVVTGLGEPELIEKAKNQLRGIA